MTKLKKAQVRLRTLLSFEYDIDKIRISKKYQDVTRLSAYIEFTSLDYITRAVEIYDHFIEQNYEYNNVKGDRDIADKIVSMCFDQLSDDEIYEYLNNI